LTHDLKVLHRTIELSVREIERLDFNQFSDLNLLAISLFLARTALLHIKIRYQMLFFQKEEMQYLHKGGK
jgi:hypothetical protein